ncbi:MAG: zinc ribbon domain-containing protein [Lachnospiraceae bacterium]|nr:zinc ribbon domain-containing protein [Lachnospiraceae bacterium]
MALISCPYCGNGVWDKAPSCPKCNADLSKLITCPNCGAKTFPKTKICPECGFKIVELGYKEDNTENFSFESKPESTIPNFQAVRSPDSSPHAQKQTSIPNFQAVRPKGEASIDPEVSGYALLSKNAEQEDNTFDLKKDRNADYHVERNFDNVSFDLTENNNQHIPNDSCIEADSIEPTRDKDSSYQVEKQLDRGSYEKKENEIPRVKVKRNNSVLTGIIIILIFLIVGVVIAFYITEKYSAEDNSHKNASATNKANSTKNEAVDNNVSTVPAKTTTTNNHTITNYDMPELFRDPSRFIGYSITTYGFILNVDTNLETGKSYLIVQKDPFHEDYFSVEYDQSGAQPLVNYTLYVFDGKIANAQYLTIDGKEIIAPLIKPSRIECQNAMEGRRGGTGKYYDDTLGLSFAVNQLDFGEYNMYAFVEIENTSDKTYVLADFMEGLSIDTYHNLYSLSPSSRLPHKIEPDTDYCGLYVFSSINDSIQDRDIELSIEGIKDEAGFVHAFVITTEP